MRRIVSGLFMTLNGVVEASGSGDVSLPEKRGWSEPFMSQGAMVLHQVVSYNASDNKKN